jgi:hypothetical protein
MEGRLGTLLKMTQDPSYTSIKAVSLEVNEEKTTKECIQKFPDWPPGPRTANYRALCH